MGETEQRLLRYVELKRIKASYDAETSITCDSIRTKVEKEVKSRFNKICMLKDRDLFIKGVNEVRSKLGEDIFTYDSNRVLFEEPSKRSYEKLKEVK